MQDKPDAGNSDETGGHSGEVMVVWDTLTIGEYLTGTPAGIARLLDGAHICTRLVPRCTRCASSCDASWSISTPCGPRACSASAGRGSPATAGCLRTCGVARAERHTLTKVCWYLRMYVRGHARHICNFLTTCVKNTSWQFQRLMRTRVPDDQQPGTRGDPLGDESWYAV